MDKPTGVNFVSDKEMADVFEATVLKAYAGELDGPVTFHTFGIPSDSASPTSKPDYMVTITPHWGDDSPFSMEVRCFEHGKIDSEIPEKFAAFDKDQPMADLSARFCRVFKDGAQCDLPVGEEYIKIGSPLAGVYDALYNIEATTDTLTDVIKTQNPSDVTNAEETDIRAGLFAELSTDINRVEIALADGGIGGLFDEKVIEFAHGKVADLYSTVKDLSPVIAKELTVAISVKDDDISNPDVSGKAEFIKYEASQPLDKMVPKSELGRSVNNAVAQCLMGSDEVHRFSDRPFIRDSVVGKAGTELLVYKDPETQEVTLNCVQTDKSGNITSEKAISTVSGPERISGAIEQFAKSFKGDFVYKQDYSDLGSGVARTDYKGIDKEVGNIAKDLNDIKGLIKNNDPSELEKGSLRKTFEEKTANVASSIQKINAAAKSGEVPDVEGIKGYVNDIFRDVIKTSSKSGSARITATLYAARHEGSLDTPVTREGLKSARNAYEEKIVDKSDPGIKDTAEKCVYQAVMGLGPDSPVMITDSLTGKDDGSFSVVIEKADENNPARATFAKIDKEGKREETNTIPITSSNVSQIVESIKDSIGKSPESVIGFSYAQDTSADENLSDIDAGSPGTDKVFVKALTLSEDLTDCCKTIESIRRDVKNEDKLGSSVILSSDSFKNKVDTLVRQTATLYSDMNAKPDSSISDKSLIDFKEGARMRILAGITELAKSGPVGLQAAKTITAAVNEGIKITKDGVDINGLSKEEVLTRVTDGINYVTNEDIEVIRTEAAGGIYTRLQDDNALTDTFSRVRPDAKVEMSKAKLDEIDAKVKANPSLKRSDLIKEVKDDLEAKKADVLKARDKLTNTSRFSSKQTMRRRTDYQINKMAYERAVKRYVDAGGYVGKGSFVEISASGFERNFCAVLELINSNIFETVIYKVIEIIFDRGSEVASMGKPIDFGQLEAENKVTLDKPEREKGIGTDDGLERRIEANNGKDDPDNNAGNTDKGTDKDSTSPDKNESADNRDIGNNVSGKDETDDDEIKRKTKETPGGTVTSGETKPDDTGDNKKDVDADKDKAEKRQTLRERLDALYASRGQGVETEKDKDEKAVASSDSENNLDASDEPDDTDGSDVDKDVTEPEENEKDNVEKDEDETDNEDRDDVDAETEDETDSEIEKEEPGEDDIEKDGPDSEESPDADEKDDPDSDPDNVGNDDKENDTSDDGKDDVSSDDNDNADNDIKGSSLENDADLLENDTDNIAKDEGTEKETETLMPEADAAGQDDIIQGPDKVIDRAGLGENEDSKKTIEEEAIASELEKTPVTTPEEEPDPLEMSAEEKDASAKDENTGDEEIDRAANDMQPDMPDNVIRPEDMDQMSASLEENTATAVEELERGQNTLDGSQEAAIDSQNGSAVISEDPSVSDRLQESITSSEGDPQETVSGILFDVDNGNISPQDAIDGIDKAADNIMNDLVMPDSDYPLDRDSLISDLSYAAGDMMGGLSDLDHVSNNDILGVQDNLSDKLGELHSGGADAVDNAFTDGFLNLSNEPVDYGTDNMEQIGEMADTVHNYVDTQVVPDIETIDPSSMVAQDNMGAVDAGIDQAAVDFNDNMTSDMSYMEQPQIYDPDVDRLNPRVDNNLNDFDTVGGFGAEDILSSLF